MEEFLWRAFVMLVSSLVRYFYLNSPLSLLVNQKIEKALTAIRTFSKIK